MISITEIILTLYFWLSAAIATIVTFIVCVISYPFVEQKTFARIYESVIGYIILKAMTIPGIWSFKITDLRNPEDQHFRNRHIFIANHASFIDTLLCAQIPSTKKFIMGKIFAQIPIFGWLCRSSGHIPVDNKDRSTTQPAVDLSVKAMEDGCSFMIFSEGKRSPDPYTMLPFKTGAFRLSQRTGVPILPMVIKGTGVGMPIGGICYPANLEIVIGHPIQVGSEWEDIEPAIKEARSFIEKHLSCFINDEDKMMK